MQDVAPAPLARTQEAISVQGMSCASCVGRVEKAIGRAMEYLESGKHANWSGFRPLFVCKLRDGHELPPHKDWVKRVFLPRMEKALSRAEKILERIR